MEDLNTRLRRVRFIVCDVDGVLTDGAIAYDGNGLPFRTVHVRDVTAFTLWHLAGGKSALVTGLGSKAVEAIAKTWKCAECHMYVKDKGSICREIAARNGLSTDELAFLGDDLIDITGLRAVGLAVAVGDAVPEVKAEAHLVTVAPGGKGPLRELVYRILDAQGRLQEVVETYCNRKNEAK
jgi:3-deoxy-D-manno-octulosonate 8-phosphate phosphatase (KDO 8-P phosphatase)